jgi:hypothetical protein
MAVAAVRCSCCDARDYRECDCPWHRPFEEWPPKKLAALKATVPRHAQAGS